MNLISCGDYLVTFLQKDINMICKITNTTIKSLQYTGQSDRIWDSEIKGFGIRVQKKCLSFFIKYRNENNAQRYYSLGRVGVLTVDEARRLAKEKLAGVCLNQDPAQERINKRHTMTVAELCDWYMDKGTGHKKPKTIQDNASTIKNHIKPLIGNRPITSVNCGMLEDLLADIREGQKTKSKTKSEKPRGVSVVRGGTYAGKKAIELLSAMFDFAIRHDKLDKNPAQGVKKPKDNNRDIFISHDELPDFGALLSNEHVVAVYQIWVNAIKLLLLTGCRKTEILSLKWEYINFDEQYFDFPDTKTGAQKRVFGRGALLLLQDLYQHRDPASPFVFPATRESKDGYITAVYKMFGVIMQTRDKNNQLIFSKPGLAIHSLRHTFASIGEYLGISPLIVGGLLGHSSGRIGVTGRYIHTVDKSLRDAADSISLEILNSLNRTSSKDVHHASPNKDNQAISNS